ncbi:hypothetical protein HZC30_00650 [Candidatus Woesearchaeota archaeon]|nr:hypothetical protein [Candidatus Woesearchaeota archaeon]
MTPAISDLNQLLKSMQPKLVSGKYVFCTVPKVKLTSLKITPKLLFQEEEGVTLILEKEVADENKLSKICSDNYPALSFPVSCGHKKSSPSMASMRWVVPSLARLYAVIPEVFDVGNNNFRISPD